MLTTSTLPANASFVDNNDGTGSFSFSPDFTQAGTFNITFYATDGALPADIDSEVVSITVTNVNQLPILATISPQGPVNEGAVLNFGVSSTDADGVDPVLTTSTLPANASFVDNNDGTGSFSFSPDFTQAGTFNITFYATDGALPADIDSEVVSITVTDVNQAPVLATISPQGPVVEGNTLNFGVTATDGDAVTPILTTSTLPTNATFVDNNDGTGSFSFSPNLTQAGVYNITFYATDGAVPSSIDSEVVSITVTDAGNQTPVLATISPQGPVTEGNTLNFGVSATDADLVTPVLSTSALPANASFIDNNDGTGSFSFTPGFTQAGVYNITFYATDGSVPSAIDSEIVSITVDEAGNQEPVLATISPQGPVTEGNTLNFGVSASDLDLVVPVLTTSALPANASFVDNNDGTGSFSFTPGFTQAGVYNITFYATDGSVPSAIDSEIVSITVDEAGNQTPVLATISPQGPVVEGSTLNFGVSATDADLVTPILTTSTLPLNATFVDNSDGTGSFSFSPDVTQSGIYTITFYATDGVVPAAIDSEIVSITVTDAGNQVPVLATISPQGPVTEGNSLSFGVSATDADLVTPILSTSALPPNASFIDNLDGTGTFNFTPDFTQSGIYAITFYATDGVVPSAIDSEVVSITVDEFGNQLPVLATISPQGPVAEGATLNFSVSASDLDAVTPILSTSALPPNASFIDNGNGTGDFSFSPDLTQAGVYNITFYATDGAIPSAIDSEIVSITVTGTNQVPVLGTISPQGPVNEGAILNFGVSAVDGDGSIPVLTTSALPTNATFNDNGNGTGSFSFSPSFTQSGIYTITFYATDAIVPTDIDSEVVSITVNNVNQVPVLATIAPVGPVAEGLTLAFSVSATDGDGTTPILTTSALPANATFIDNGNGTGGFSFSPNVSQAGVYTITFRATDGLVPAAIDSEVVTISVIETGNNASPIVSIVNDTSIAENQVLVINVSAIDPEAGPVSLSVSTSLQHYSFVDHNNGTGTLTYSPTYTDQGIDTVRFIATDFGLPRLSGTEIAVITTNEVNQVPQFVPAGPFAVKVGKVLTFTLTAKDPTAPDTTTRIFVSGLGLPANSFFVDNGNSTGTFTFTPSAGQVGTDTITFLATDQGTPSQTAQMNVVVIVRPTNALPVLAPIGPRQVLEGNTLVINLSATDTDGPLPIVFSADNQPNNSSFTDNGNGTGQFTFTPNFAQQGLYAVTIKAFDGLDIDKEIVFIQVLDAGNQTPVVDSAAAQATTEGSPVTGRIVTHDPDNGTITITVQSGTAPFGFVLVDSGNGIATYSFTPDFSQSGVWNIGIIASDGTAADTSVLVITVADAGNQPPTLNPIADVTSKELRLISIHIISTDPDSTASIITSSALPPGATLVDSGNGRARFRWVPTISQEGVYAITFRAQDFDSPATIDSQQVIFTILDTTQMPIIFVNPTQRDSMMEGEVLNYIALGSDPDGVPPTLRATLSGQDSLATNMIFTDSGNGTGVLRFSPNFTQGNANPNFYNVIFKAIDATDTTLQATSFTIAFRVYNRNQKPVQNFSLGTGPFTIVGGDSVVFTVSSTDPDGGTPTTFAQNIPANASYTGSTNVKVFRFSPTLAQVGSYVVRFMSEDIQGLRDTINVSFNVTSSSNQAPVLATISPQGPVNEGATLNFNVSASDLDAVIPILTTSALPANASFVDNLNGTGTFNFSPNFSQSGTYNITFYATDGAVPSSIDSEVVAITVTDVGSNNPPTFTTTLPDTINAIAGLTTQTPVGAIDIDADSLSLSVVPVLANSVFIDNTDGSGLHSFSPTVGEIGNVYEVRFIVTDHPSLTSDTLITHFLVTASLRGDADNDAKYTLNDIVKVLHYLFRNGSSPQPFQAGDADNTGSVNLGDVSYMINFIYNAGPRPPQ